MVLIFTLTNRLFAQNKKQQQQQQQIYITYYYYDLCSRKYYTKRTYTQVYVNTSIRAKKKAIYLRIVIDKFLAD